MTRARRPILDLLRAAALPAGCMLVIGYFLYAAVLGQNGLLRWSYYRTQLAARHADLAGIVATRDQLQHRSDLLDPRHVDPDLADELVRERTDQVRTDEVIVPVR